MSTGETLKEIGPNFLKEGQTYEIKSQTRDIIVLEVDGVEKQFISSRKYAKKYGLGIKAVAPICRPARAGNRPPGFIAYKGSHHDEYRNKLTYLWYVLDINPNEHPGYQAYLKSRRGAEPTAGSNKDRDFDKWAPVFLERFNRATDDYEKTNFTVKELASMLQVDSYRVLRWADYGVKDYGKLPRIMLPNDQTKLKDAHGNYVSQIEGGGKNSYVFATKDIKRFLKKKLADPKALFRTVDDALEETNRDEIIAEEGFFIYDPAKAFPMTYEGFLKWATTNVFFTDQKTRKRVPFVPNGKQREFYKKAFELNPDGSLKHKIIGCCRPRGDYKSFDVMLLLAFRLFNLPEQTMYFVANSVEQSSHALFKELVKMIKRSPTLMTTPGLDIQAKGVYLMSGKGKENVYSFVEIISAEGGARSNATCFGWSEAWKFRGNESDIAEIEQSIRGVDNGWFLIESTVAPKGHFFHRYYEDALTGENEILYFQYYDGSQRQNPKIDEKYLKHVKRIWPLHYKMYFDNRWEDAALGIFSDERIVEIGVLGIDGGTTRSNELISVCARIVELQRMIKKLGAVSEITHVKAELDRLQSRLYRVDDVYSLPAPANVLELLEKIYGCEFFLGIGLDRAKQFTQNADRSCLVTIAKAVTGADSKIFFLLDLYMPAQSSGSLILQRISENIEMYGGGMGYVDLEDYNVLDLKEQCIKSGYEVEIAPNSFKHQEQIFTELYNASEDGYLKAPMVPLWCDNDGIVHSGLPPVGKEDILRFEMKAFVGYPAEDGRKAGYFGSSYKQATKRTKSHEPKDDTIFGLGHGVNAANRGEVPAIIGGKSIFSGASENKDVIGKYS